MMRAAICDDEAKTRIYLASLIRKQPCPCEVVEYASAEECLADGRRVDLLFLDIELKDSGLSGMDLAWKLRERSPEMQPVIIFVTAHEKYVFDAFDVGAFQYLIKPVNEEKFAKVFLRAAELVTAEREMPQKVRTLTLQSASTNRIIPVSHIVYIESSNHKVALHLKDEVFACYAKLGDLEMELQDPFFRIHKGYLINLAKVETYGKTEVVLTDGNRLPISKYKYQDFIRAYLDFLKKRAGL